MGEATDDPHDPTHEAPEGPHIALYSVDGHDSAALNVVRALFLEYQDDIGIDLGFQGFAQELAELPGAYAPPQGALLLATVDGEPAGCCALRPLLDSDHGVAAEMKRLFVRRAFRGFGLGRLLAERIVLLAQQAGYDCVLLDTLREMEAARSLYHEMGFVEIPPYYHNPLPGAHYLKLSL
ncbi:GNAT family N-acetyltransferase [Tepidimonas charontis]|uniref:Acetyltransferase (GNAT) family protein n=1 Tax=Tepidimonas charontis TaxID=2267262 RepID=A0A554X4D0_9BURK|nr:GNAT family N-acetyltransferase [Tepidimonas charontis]TSE30668.1 Acetyltransferase (GNAT) family protein [Tepidimonas charontis]